MVLKGDIIFVPQTSRFNIFLIFSAIVLKLGLSPKQTNKHTKQSTVLSCYLEGKIAGGGGRSTIQHHRWLSSPLPHPISLAPSRTRFTLINHVQNPFFLFLWSIKTGPLMPAPLASRHKLYAGEHLGCCCPPDLFPPPDLPCREKPFLPRDCLPCLLMSGDNKKSYISFAPLL